mmetsp:Transcript_36705/g.93536  ORF Transcript_36705/g.93536 Transcript_36705/m.93536 type:complete len:244 (+) Transcript_36705:128-859(+)
MQGPSRIDNNNPKGEHVDRTCATCEWLVCPKSLGGRRIRIGQIQHLQAPSCGTTTWQPQRLGCSLLVDRAPASKSEATEVLVAACSIPSFFSLSTSSSKSHSNEQAVLLLFSRLGLAPRCCCLLQRRRRRCSWAPVAGRPRRRCRRGCRKRRRRRNIRPNLSHVTALRAAARLLLMCTALAVLRSFCWCVSVISAASYLGEGGPFVASEIQIVQCLHIAAGQSSVPDLGSPPQLLRQAPAYVL